MKIFQSVPLVFVSALTAIQAARDGSGIPFSIGISCDGGWDPTNLSPSNAVFTSRAIEDSFNRVHQKIDNGDSELSGTSYRYTGSTWVTTYNCHLCPVDDDLFHREADTTGGGASLQGSLQGSLGAWEEELAATFAASRRPGFATITTCIIDMTSG